MRNKFENYVGKVDSIKKDVKDYLDYTFSEDCPFQKRVQFVSATSTAVFWFIMMIFLAVAPVGKKKNKYKTVQIVLSPMEPEKKTTPKKETTAPAAPAPAPKEVSEAPVVEKAPSAPAPKKIETPKKAETPKPAPKAEPVAKPAPAKTPSPKAVETPVYEDPMEAFNRQVSQKKTSSFDWSSFDDEPVTSNSTASQSENYVKNSNSISGTAGTTASNQSTGAKTQASQTNVKAGSADSSTTSALSNIVSRSFVGNNTFDVESKVYVESSTSNGKVTIKMKDGTSRALLDPATPVINLSQQAQDSIDGNKTVNIEFTVLANGNVPLTRISITPSSILPPLVRDEVCNQISKWRFETASTDSMASFEYTIRKRF